MFQVLFIFFFLSRYKLEKISVMNEVSHTGKMERENFIRVHYRVILLP